MKAGDNKMAIVTTSWLAQGLVAVVEFADLASANALRPEGAARLTAAIEQAGQSAACVVLRSPGKTFCAGVDLDFVADLGAHEASEQTRQYVYGSFQRLVRAIADCPVPVIARLHGGALGLGADVALACDMRVAGRSAYLRESWILLGTTSALGGACVLERACGPGRALELLLTGRAVAGAELATLGLAEYVVEDNGLDAAVTELAEQIATRDRQAIIAAKALVRGVSKDSWEATLNAALEYQVALISRPEFRNYTDQMKATIRSRGGHQQ
jgi:enoyl-CoA hydratase/carnithine racemase